MLKHVKRTCLFALVLAIFVSSVMIASANEKIGNDEASLTTQNETSGYVIENKSSNKGDIVVTVEHYNGNDKIYSDDVRTLSYGAKINDYAKATNWKVSDVSVTLNGITLNVSDKSLIELTSSGKATIKVSYTAKNATVDGPTTFYDYTVASDDSYKKYVSNGWYQYTQTVEQYKSFNSLGDEVGTNGKLTAGTKNNNWANNYQYSYDCNVTENDGNVTNANVWTESDKPVTGIVKGLNDDGSVHFNYPEPGFFVDSNVSYNATEDGSQRYLRKVYKNFSLKFNQTGDTYQLASVYDNDKKASATNAGNDFFPLDNYKDAYEKDSVGHNYFFGMRYDVNFKIGDYIGALDYNFTGDDDLWVILDGNKVVIDLGGIHNAATGKANLWESLGLWDNANKKPVELTEEQKNQEHTLTILYMERGAYLSNCQMNFTLPSARISEVTNIPMADLTFNKVNSEGAGISGAAFKLVKDKEEGATNTPDEIYTASSYGNDGTVKFEKLKVGTYTLTETMASNGYMASTNTWKVEVTESNGIATAKLLNSDRTEVELTNGRYKLVNYTPEEFVKNNLELNKTAKVKDWDNRTYDINLSASTKGQTTTTTTTRPVVDIIMVLDVSGSMNRVATAEEYVYLCDNTETNRNKLDKKKTYYVKDGNRYLEMKYITGTNNRNNGWQISNQWASNYNNYKIYEKKDSITRLNALKNAANQFIEDTATNSPNSKIGIVTFSSSSNIKSELTIVGTGKENLKNEINKLSANGGTKPNLGLNNANSMLNKDDIKNDGKAKYVILFTDGAPTGDNEIPNGANTDNYFDNNVVSSSNSIAKTLKTNGATIYTIGFGLSNKSKTFLAGGSYGNIKYDGIATDADHAKNADDAASLNAIFNEISESITNYAELSNATVTDIVDKRFVIVGDDGNIITNEMLKDGRTVTLKNGGVVSLNAQGEQVVTWTGQTIPNKAIGSWSRSLVVKAKDNYIGGNNVTTNGAESGITVEGVTKPFPQPTVNVKSELSITNKEITIYKGDQIPSDNEIIQEVAGKYLDHHGVSTDNFTVIKTNNDQQSNTPSKDTTYQVKVIYNNLGAPTDASTSNTDGKVSGEQSNENYVTIAKNDGVIHAGNETKNDVNLKGQDYGQYIVHVISGQLTIVKTLDDNKKADEDTEFEFTITGPNYSNEVKVKIAKGQNTGTSEVIKELSRGTYTITEKDADGYELKSYEFISKTDSYIKDNTITLGNDTNNQNVIENYQYKGNGVKGTIEFTNKPVIKNWNIIKVRKDSKEAISGAKFVLKQNDQIKYKGVSGDNGYITWSTTDNQPLAEGEYILEETEAAQGYAKGDMTWKLKISKGGNLESITDSNGNPIESRKNEHVYEFVNDVPYSLPEAGGSGIYYYTVGGMLLMIAAAFIVYRKRYNEFMNK